MIIWLSERLRKEDEGFTLIELMVVVLIIAILIAIAIPTFLGARRRAQDRQAQSNLRNALTSEKTYYADWQAYTTSTTPLQEIETNLNWGEFDARARGVVVVNTFDVGGVVDAGVILTSESASGREFCLMDIASGTGAGTFYANVDNVNALTEDCPDETATWEQRSDVGWSY